MALQSRLRWFRVSGLAFGVPGPSVEIIIGKQDAAYMNIYIWDLGTQSHTHTYIF